MKFSGLTQEVKDNFLRIIWTTSYATWYANNFGKVNTKDELIKGAILIADEAVRDFEKIAKL